MGIVVDFSQHYFPTFPFSKLYKCELNENVRVNALHFNNEAGLQLNCMSIPWEFSISFQDLLIHTRCSIFEIYLNGFIIWLFFSEKKVYRNVVVIIFVTCAALEKKSCFYRIAIHSGRKGPSVYERYRQGCLKELTNSPLVEVAILKL